MSHSANIQDSHFLSAVEAGRQFGYTNDYIAKLAREKKISAARVGREWFVDAISLGNFIARSNESKRARAERIRQERKEERKRTLEEIQGSAVLVAAPLLQPRSVALLKAGAISLSGFAFGTLMFMALPYMERSDIASASVMDAMKVWASRLYSFNVTDTAGGLGEVPPSEPSPTTQQGMLVLPHDGGAGMHTAESFSDEVTFTYDEDGKSGIITPVFKGEKDQSYRFMLVPLTVPDK